LAIVPLLLLVPQVALSATPNAAAEKEARSYLRPCKQSDEDLRQLCLLHQRNFIEQYVYAKANDYLAQSSTAGSFDTRHKDDDLSWIGMPQNQIQSCAWRLVIVQIADPESPSSSSYAAQSTCGVLQPLEQTLALRRADELVRELRTHPAAMPDDDWEPKVRGLVDEPLPPKALDSTAEPLTSDDP
jgi:hypothetical protein